MDKNELNEHLQWIIGMAKTVEHKINSSETLGMADYLDLEEGIKGMLKELELARTVQYTSE